jgi:tRNA pseudouridine38-40 synthase
MVRNLVGSLLEVARGRRPASWLAEVLAARDRRLAGPTAPARGLLLAHVAYDDFRPQSEGLGGQTG